MEAGHYVTVGSPIHNDLLTVVLHFGEFQRCDCYILPIIISAKTLQNKVN